MMSRICFAGLLFVSLLLSPVLLSAEVVPVRPALHWAAENGLTDVATLLIEQGADVDETDHFGNTALHLALAYPDLMALLLENGANVNARNAMGNTPLHLAVKDRGAVETLLAAGADVNARNGLGKTPLNYAMRQGTSPYNLSIVELLIRAGAR
jgi:ankyrin repeat protein